MIYRGKEGQWSWVLHRITGIGVLLFLLTHILDTMLVGWGPEIYNKVMSIYRHPFFKIGEVGLFAAVLYHALNGIRIILVDFWPRGTQYHRQMFYGEVILFFLAMIPVSFLMLSH
ncbi:MAG: succinate dehydrogenase, cytochrome b556 subunit [Elusimicrobia bacterium]|nr:succinate dehydrogenase, cytochrome b556 subunit [Elusimicrobiota bacterium]MBI4218144.1 succinate dehydrogenase, cytochrome b556 subunit [Elusimicrobiota bacterium]